MKDSLKKGFLSLIIIVNTCAHAFGENSGEELYRQGKFKEAVDAFQKADMDHPKEVRFRYNRGCAAYQDGDLDASEAAFTSVLKRSDDNEIRFRSLYNRGVAAFQKGDFHGAARDFKEALKLNPDDEDARFNFELSLRRKMEEKEKENQQQQGEKDPNRENKEGEDTQRKTQDQKNEDQKGSSEKEQDKDRVDENEPQGGKQAQGEKPKQERHDLSGELRGKEKKNTSDQTPPVAMPLTDSQMARNKAEALLENVKDDPSIILQMMRDQEKEISRSGKKW